MKLKKISPFIFIFLIIFCSSVDASQGQYTLSMSVRDADLIVVGEISNIVDNAFSITYSFSRHGRNYSTTHIYAIGRMHEYKILKREVAVLNISLDENSKNCLEVAFFSQFQ